MPPDSLLRGNDRQARRSRSAHAQGASLPSAVPPVNGGRQDVAPASRLSDNRRLAWRRVGAPASQKDLPRAALPSSSRAHNAQTVHEYLSAPVVSVAVRQAERSARPEYRRHERHHPALNKKR